MPSFRAWLYEVSIIVPFAQPSKAAYSLLFVCLLYTFVVYTTVNKEYIYIYIYTLESGFTNHSNVFLVHQFNHINCKAFRQSSQKMFLIVDLSLPMLESP